MSTVTEKAAGQLAYPYGRVSSDEEVLSAILNALHHNTGVPQDSVRVEVHDGHAVLSGKVEQDFERSLAERIAKTAPGVIKVTNQLTLAS